MYYNQDTEVHLLVQFLNQLENKRVIDVGAERGNFVEALLQAGAEHVYAIEPYPPSVSVLNQRFGSHPAVHILEMALGDREQTVILHIIKDKTSAESDSFHSTVPFHETPMLQPTGELEVQCRTLNQLIIEGVIPGEVGILKIDAERSDFDVLRGMGTLESAIVMVEFWDDLPETVGATPYRLDDIIRFMRARGYSNYLLVKRRNEFEVIQVNSNVTHAGEWGNVLFIHDPLFDKLSSLIYSASQEAQTRLVDQALLYQLECKKRLAVIEEQSKALAAFSAALSAVSQPSEPIKTDETQYTEE